MLSNNLPITFKVPRNTSGVEDWLIRCDMFTRVAYDWETSLISFEDRNDALAFSLAFNIERFETKVERMLKNA